MKTKTTLLFLIVTIFGLFFTSCKKYEEGPLISFRSAHNRIYGSHILTQYTVNGADSLSQYYDSLGLDFLFYYDDVHYREGCTMDGRRRDGSGTSLYWNWQLTNHNKNFNVYWAGGSSIGVGPFGINKTPNWEIIKLKRKQIKLKTVYSGKEYIIELNAVDF